MGFPSLLLEGKPRSLKESLGIRDGSVVTGGRGFGDVAGASDGSWSQRAARGRRFRSSETLFEFLNF